MRFTGSYTEVEPKKLPRNCKMSGDEGTTATNTASTASVGSAQIMQQSSLPSGILMPKPLNLDNVAANWFWL